MAPVCTVARDLAQCHVSPKARVPRDSVTFRETVQPMKQRKELFSCMLVFLKSFYGNAGTTHSSTY